MKMSVNTGRAMYLRTVQIPWAAIIVPAFPAMMGMAFHVMVRIIITCLLWI